MSEFILIHQSYCTLIEAITQNAFLGTRKQPWPLWLTASYKCIGNYYITRQHNILKRSAYFASYILHHNLFRTTTQRQFLIFVLLVAIFLRHLLRRYGVNISVSMHVMVLKWYNMNVMASQITRNWTVGPKISSGYQQRQIQGHMLLAFCEGIPF